MKDDYYLALDAYNRYVQDDTRPPIKVVRELEASDHEHALLTAAIIRNRYQGKFLNPEAVLAALIKAGEKIGYAQYLAGLCYANGYGTRKHRKTAARRYQKGADMAVMVFS
jgi:TPR repeat protein